MRKPRAFDREANFLETIIKLGRWRIEAREAVEAYDLTQVQAKATSAMRPAWAGVTASTNQVRPLSCTNEPGPGPRPTSI